VAVADEKICNSHILIVLIVSTFFPAMCIVRLAVFFILIHLTFDCYRWYSVLSKTQGRRKAEIDE
ncbi:MAG: hypothetical protein RR933_07285, partial [Oscillospiraceae bacterium]